MNLYSTIKTPLMSHQLRLVEAFKRLKVGYLKGDMGTGKTLAMLAVAEQKKGKYLRIVWVAPCSTIQGLKEQINEHSTGFDIRFFSYEAIQSSNKAYSLFCYAIEDAFLVLDEAHFLKNRNAKRTKRIQMVAGLAKYRFAMSGTPMGLDLYDYFSQLMILSNEIWGYSTWRAFETFHIQRKHVAGSFGKREVMKTVGSYELIQRLKPYLYEFRKNELLKFLPPKKYSIIKHKTDTATNIAYDDTKKEILDKYAEYGLFQNAVYMLITALHQVIGLDDSRIALLDGIVDKLEGKVIVWCKYRAEIDLIVKLTKHSSMVIDGRTNHIERHNIIKEFKEGNTKILITNQACGGVGLNLQFCSKQIFYNQSWCSIQREQAEDRIHRIGQKADDCQYIDIVGNLPIEQMLHACLNRKLNLKSFVNEMIGKNAKLSKEDIIERFGKII